MITLDELLIKIGVDGSQAQKISGYVDMLQGGADSIGASANAINDKLDGILKEVSNSLGEASNVADQASKDLNKAGDSAEKTEGKISKLKVAMAALIGGAMLFGNKIASAFNAAIDSAEQLFKSKNALLAISRDEIAQVDQYKKSLDKTSLSINSIRTKIAINLVPALTAVSEKFNGWLVTNKDFITNGISKVILWLGRGVQVITNFMKFIDKVVRSTIGWKNAFIALGVAWAVLNRAFLFSPIGVVIGLFGALLLLVDDLMVYLDGGKSLFGDYWNPLIDGAKTVINWFNSLSETTQKVLGASGVLTLAMIFFGGTAVKMFGKIVAGVKFATTAFRAFSLVVMSNPIIAVLTAIAVAAYLIYDNWDWLSAKFKEIWGNISKWATEAWDTITDTSANAIKDILMWFGMSEEGAEQTVNAMKDVFSLIFEFITSPFTRAFNLVKDLFKIWNDDSKSATQKFKSSFSAVYDYIVSPFKTAMRWIDDKFNGFLDATLGNLADALSFIGIDIGYEKRSGQLDAGDDVSPSATSTSLTMGKIGSLATDVPSPVNGASVRNDVRVDSKIEIHATDSLDGAKRAGDYLADQIGKASDFNKSAVRG